jgi:YVTN family beta-propeller protein
MGEAGHVDLRRVSAVLAAALLAGGCSIGATTVEPDLAPTTTVLVAPEPSTGTVSPTTTRVRASDEVPATTVETATTITPVDDPQTTGETANTSTPVDEPQTTAGSDFDLAPAAGTGPRWSSTIVLSPDGSLVYVANPDSASVSAVDTAAGSTRWEVTVGERPTSVALDGAGAMLFVTVTGEDRLVVLDARTGDLRAEIMTGRRPAGVVVTPDDRMIVVAEGDVGTVALFDLQEFVPITRISVGAEPRGLAVTADGSSVLVTHLLTGDLTVIDLTAREVRAVIATGQENNASRHVALHPDGRRAFMPLIRSRTSNPDLMFETTIMPRVAVVDLEAGQVVPRELLGLDAVDRPVNMPSAVAFSPDGVVAYVANSGSDDLSVIDLTKGFGIGHIEVGANPQGLVVTADGRTAYVHNALSDDLSVVDLDELVEVRRIATTSSLLPDDVRAGKVLFFGTSRPEMARDQWISCASCHLEGGHDARTWILDDGPRNTPPIRGLMLTDPFHWSGNRVDLFDFQKTIRDLQAGTGLSDAENGDLAAFLSHALVQPSPYPPTERTDRGREVFGASGCATCHAGPVFTDGLLHDVGTGDGSGENQGSAFDTPTLLGLYDSAPYLHDGSARTLGEVFTLGDRLGPHFLAELLTDEELDAVLGYLRSIPQ